MDDVGIPLLVLTHVSLDERRGGAGRSLVDAAQAVRNLVAQTPAAPDDFDDGLIEYGLLPDQQDRYTEPRFTVREIAHLHVQPGFPRITESDLPEGVGDVKYRVQLGALAPYTTDLEDLIVTLKGEQ